MWTPDVSFQPMIYEKHIHVRYAEIGIGGRIKPVSIFNYFQDIASEHTAALGVSAWDLLPLGLAWVIYKYQIEIQRYPMWNEHLKIRTWRNAHQKLYELRRYEVYDNTHQKIIQAKTLWVLTRLSSKKPVRIDRHLPLLVNSHHLQIENDLPNVEPLAHADWKKIFQIRLHDLDFNGHVNNAIYPVWAMESVPAHILTTHSPQQIIINYIGESLYGDRILSSTQQFHSKKCKIFLHSLASEKTGKEITRIKTIWDKTHDPLSNPNLC